VERNSKFKEKKIQQGRKVNMDEVRIEVQFFDNQQARLYHRLNHDLYRGEAIIIIEFVFNGLPHVLTLANNDVNTAIQLVRNEFDENFDEVDGLRRTIFNIGDILTAYIVDYEVWDFGERDHDEDDDNSDNEDEYEENVNRPDPQSRE